MPVADTQVQHDSGCMAHAARLMLHESCCMSHDCVEVVTLHARRIDTHGSANDEHDGMLDDLCAALIHDLWQHVGSSIC